MHEPTSTFSRNSTTVRIERNLRDTRGACLRLGFGALGAVAPPLVSGLAERLFFAAPPRRAPSVRQAAALATGRPFTVRMGTQRIAAWSWGEGPAVLLVHGWGGLGAQLAGFVPSFVGHGRSVITFDAPGHGASEGRRSSILDFAEAIHAVAGRSGPLAGVVAHSLGSLATALAIRDGLDVARAVFIGPPSDPSDYFSRFLRHVGVPVALRAGVSRDLERRNHFRWADLSARALGSPKVPLLVLHDEDDAAVPWTAGAEVADAWPGARFVRSRGLGHSAILRDPGTIGIAGEFLLGLEIRPREIAPRLAACATVGCVREACEGERLCEACALEVELYHRAARWP